MTNINSYGYHQPVLLTEVINYLVTDENGIYFEGTLGGGGHTQALLSKLSDQGRVISTDRDKEAIAYCTEKFKNEPRLTMLHHNFSQVKEIDPKVFFQGALLDLGVSSHQLDQDDRGFSFKQTAQSEKLDMRMDSSSNYTAVDYLQKTSAEEIAQDFVKNADLPCGLSYKVAKLLKEKIVTNDKIHMIANALSELYPKGLPKMPQMLARIFLSIRIQVNQEKKQVVDVVDTIIKRLNIGGRFCIISFHSVEDRWVKNSLKKYEKKCICPPSVFICNCGNNHQKIKKVLRKPLMATSTEINENVRSRSAKLRVVEKIAV